MPPRRPRASPPRPCAASGPSPRIWPRARRASSTPSPPKPRPTAVWPRRCAAMPAASRPAPAPGRDRGWAERVARRVGSPRRGHRRTGADAEQLARGAGIDRDRSLAGGARYLDDLHAHRAASGRGFTRRRDADRTARTGHPESRSRRGSDVEESPAARSPGSGAALAAPAPPVGAAASDTGL